jgi:hypothetical protein
LIVLPTRRPVSKARIEHFVSRYKSGLNNGLFHGKIRIATVVTDSGNRRTRENKIQHNPTCLSQTLTISQGRRAKTPKPNKTISRHGKHWNWRFQNKIQLNGRNLKARDKFKESLIAYYEASTVKFCYPKILRAGQRQRLGWILTEV